MTSNDEKGHFSGHFGFWGFTGMGRSGLVFDDAAQDSYGSSESYRNTGRVRSADARNTIEELGPLAFRSIPQRLVARGQSAGTPLFRRICKSQCPRRMGRSTFPTYQPG